MDQGKGAVKSGPNDIPKFDSELRSLSSQGILAQTKISIMQQVVAKWPKVSISSEVVQIPSLLNFGSEASLICHTYFKRAFAAQDWDPYMWKSRCPCAI